MISITEDAVTAAAGAWAPLRIREFRRWFIAQILSGSGGMAQGVAIAWLTLKLTNSGFDLGLMSVATWSPVLLGGAWGGFLIDHFGSRRLLLCTQVAGGLIAIALGILCATGSVRLWMVFVLALASGVVFAVDQPARQIYVVDLVGAERVQNAIGLFEVIINASRVLGPSAGGVLIATVGVSGCFFVNAASFIPALLVLLSSRPATAHITPEHAHGVLGALQEGITYVRHNPVILVGLAVAAALGMVFNTGTALPLLATRTFHLGGVGYGLLLAMFGIGAIPGGYAAASSGGHRRQGRTIVALCLASAAAVFATALAPVSAMAFPLLAVVGLCTIWLIATTNALVQLEPPPEIRGRVVGLWTMILPGLYPITGLLAGSVSQLISPRAGFALAGVALLVTVALGARTLVAYDGPQEPPRR